MSVWVNTGDTDGPRAMIVNYLIREQNMKKTISGLLGAGVIGLALIANPVSTKAADGDPEKGKEVFEQCSVCHNADSTEAKAGPGLKGLFKKDKLKNGKKPTEANVRAMINTGGTDGKMPPYADMDETEKTNLIAYLKTL
jgi:cytochrome c